MRLGFIKKLAGTMVLITTKPTTRIDHAKPTFGRRLSRIPANIKPPNELPMAHIARARLRFLEKYVPTNERAGQKTRPPPIPAQIPWESIICQYFVAKEAPKRPRS
jgi:hypothetical protein